MADIISEIVEEVFDADARREGLVVSDCEFLTQSYRADPSAALESFRSQVAGQMDHAPDPLFLAEVAGTKRKLTEMMAILAQNAVNGEVHESHFLQAIEEAAQWSSRFGNPQN